MTTLNPTLRWVGPHVTVCNYFNYWWTFLADHISEEDATGTVAAHPGQDRAARAGELAGVASARPSRPTAATIDPVQHALFGDAVELHDQPLRRARSTSSGNADCETGQRGYPERLADRLPPSYNIVIDPRTPGNQGPTFTGRARVPEGQTFSAEPDRHRAAGGCHETRARPERLRRRRRRCSSSSCVVTYLGFTKDIPFVNEPYEIKAAFRDTSGHQARSSPVRIAGVEVGEVTKVEHTSPGAQSATVTMAIRDEGRPIHADATAKIRPRIFLEGNFFVDLAPGSPRRRRARRRRDDPGRRARRPRCSSTRCSRRCKSDTRNDLRDDLRRARRGAGRRRRARPSTTRCATSPPPTSSRRSSPRRCSASARRPRRLGPRPGHRGRRARRRPGAAARARRRLQHDRRRARRPRERRCATPSASCRARCAPRRRRSTRSTPRSPTCAASRRGARPGVRSLGPTVDAMLPLVQQLRGLVAAPTSCAAWRATCARATPPLRAARQDARRAARRSCARCRAARPNVLVPFGNDTLADKAFPAHGPVYQELAKFLPGLAGESRSFDANGQWFKVLGSGGAETLEPRQRALRHRRSSRSSASTRRRSARARRCAPTCRARRRSRPTCARSRAAPPAAIARTRAGRARARPRRRRRPSAVAARASSRPGPDAKVAERAATLDDIRAARPATASPSSSSSALKRAGSDEPRHPQEPRPVRGDPRARRDRRRVVGALHPQRAAPALPVRRADSRCASTSSSTTRRRSRPARARRVAGRRREDRRHRRGQAARRARDRRRSTSSRSTRTSSARDARALLRPRTGLKDMYVQIFPGKDGRAGARRASRSRVAQHADRRRPRRDPLRARRAHARLRHAAGQRRAARAWSGRGNDLAEVFERFGRPCATSRRVNHAVARGARRAAARSSRRSPQLNGELARKPEDLARLVDASRRRRSRAFASEDDNLRDAVGELAPTLRQATTTLRAVRPFAARARARRRARCCRPCARSTTPTRAVSPFAREATPIVRDEIRPFVRARAAARRATSRPPRAAWRATLPELARSGAVAQPLRQHARPQPGRPRGPGQGRPRGGLPVLARLAHAPDGEPAEHRRRQRPDAPDLPDRHVHDAHEPRQRPARSSSSRSACRRCSPRSAATRTRPSIDLVSARRCAQRSGLPARGGER